ncbi:hypothetical protein PIROE2DRAFT_5446 [Piromyces sp. E2]|nr:hypothetical protein PIROE2DRAFT_5446 [Piromyces sp. E2]|eukprot:OUM67178.1 hypothetical protein PIROE2DRAFT_5446 [Piromyces sp. E2]
MGIYIKQLKTLIWKNIKIKKEVVNSSCKISSVVNYEEYSYEKEGSVKPIDVRELFRDHTNINRTEFIDNLRNNDIFTHGNNEYYVKIKTFIDEESLIDYKTKNKNQFLAEVKFYNYTNYVIRIDGETLVDPNSNPIGSYFNSRKMMVENNSTDADSYLNAFVPIQLAIDQTIIQNKLNKKIIFNTNIGKMSKPGVNITLMDNNANNEILTMKTEVLPLIFFILLINLMKSIINEKEKKQEEGLITIGVHPTAFILIEYVYQLGIEHPLLEKLICLCLSPINFSMALCKLNLANVQHNYITFSNLSNSEFGIYLLLMLITILLYHGLVYIDDYEKDPINNGYPLIEVKEIFKLYKNKINNGKKYVNVLDGISFNVYNNEIFAILGHNGAGKSTLIKIMTGLLKSDHGSI